MRSLTISDPAFTAPRSSSPPLIASTVGVWWAGDLALADTDPVSSWTDRVNSLAITQGTAGSRPTFDADGIGGKPSVNFSADDFLTLSATISVATSGCVVAVVLFDDPDNAASIQTVAAAGNSPDSTRYVRFCNSGSTGLQRLYQRNAGTAGSNSTIDGPTIPVTAAALEWSSTGTAFGMRSNNTAATLTAAGGADDGDWFGDTTIDRWTLGAQVGATTSFYFTGRIAYLGVFNAELSGGDRTALYAWIGSHYGITVA